MARAPGKNAPWYPGPGDPEWNRPEVARLILGDYGGPPSWVALGDLKKAIPVEWKKLCAFRLRKMRNALRESYFGFHDPETGWLVDWVLASLVARENVLLLGPPGVAKSEIASRTCQLLGLETPVLDNALLAEPMPENAPRPWWEAREAKERQTQKYFQYLLSRFTQPEELFGPIEISLLRKGMLVRVNFGLLTGAGVRAAFLDEIFKASSSILNTLLTLCQERRYFNWGAMVPSDLLVLIGASNEMPGSFASGGGGVGTRGDEDFQTLHAFVDRFPVRLLLPAVSGKSNSQPETADVGSGRRGTDPATSDLGNAFQLAIDREGRRFVEGQAFEKRPVDMPCLNDLLLLGRACLQHRWLRSEDFDADGFARYARCFIHAGTDLREGATNTETGAITWSISPRKLKAVYKIGLAHALIVDDGFSDPRADRVRVTSESLNVFKHIWDSPTAKHNLASQTRALIAEFW